MTEKEDLRILVIDDEPAILRSFSLLLKTKGFSSVFTMDDANNCEYMIEKHQPNTVLLDLNMPQISGEEILKIITKKYPKIRTILISADSDADKRQQFIKLGAYDYLVKPIEINTLIDCIIR